MGLIIGLIKRIIKLILYFTLFVAVVLLLPNLPPYTKFTKIEIEPPLPRDGALTPNEDLNNAQQMYKEKIIGPEALRVYNGELYTGLATGEIVKISPGMHITFVTKIGQPCTGLPQEHICGRPLGFEIDEKNKLMYIADAYHGIWKFNLNTNKKQLLVSPREEIDGKQVKIFNGIALGKNGELYWTHSSSDFDLKDGAMTCFSDPSGRLLHYDPATNKSKVLLDNLWFANGIAISPDNQFVVVAESHRYRLMRYYLSGPKKGKSDVFIAGLPGVPDNLQALPDGSGVLVSLYVAFDNKYPVITRSLASTPLARKFLGRLSRLIEIPLEFLHKQYPHFLLEDIIYKIGHFSTVTGFMPEMSGLIQLDWNGNIVSSYFNTDRSIGSASDVIVFNDKLLIGSPHSHYLASVPVPPLLKKAFSKTQAPTASNPKKEEAKKSQAKVESASPATNVKSSEKDKVKVVGVKEIPSTAKPAVQKSSQDKDNINNPQVNKKNREPSKKDKFETQPIKTIDKSEAKNTGTKQAVNSQKQSTKESINHQKTEKTVPKDDSKKLENKQNINEKQDKSGKKTKENLNVVPSEPAKTPNVNKKEPVKTTAKSAEKLKAQKNTETLGTKSSKAKVDKPIPDQIPVQEDIPSDRMKPNEETLKVIKKTGPVEIPNPN